MPKRKRSKRKVRSSELVVRDPKTSRFARRIQKIFHQFLTYSSFRTKLFFLTGAILVIIPTFFYINEGVQLAFFTPKVPVVAKTLPAPVWISIPSVDMELPIVEQAISHGAWGVAQNGISHLNTSARPGETGPIILYGHNTDDRFGPIRWLSKGAHIIVKTTGNNDYTYTVVDTMDVAPDKVSVLLSQKGQTLILYTCDGFADLQRFVVIAKPI